MEKKNPHTSNHHFSCNQVDMSFHILSLDCFSLFIVVAKQGESLGNIFFNDDFLGNNKILNAVSLFAPAMCYQIHLCREAQTKMSKLPLVGSTLSQTLGSKLSKSFTGFSCMIPIDFNGSCKENTPFKA